MNRLEQIEERSRSLHGISGTFPAGVIPSIRYDIPALLAVVRGVIKRLQIDDDCAACDGYLGHTQDCPLAVLLEEQP